MANTAAIVPLWVDINELSSFNFNCVWFFFNWSRLVKKFVKNILLLCTVFMKYDYIIYILRFSYNFCLAEFTMSLDIASLVCYILWHVDEKLLSVFYFQLPIFIIPTRCWYFDGHLPPGHDFYLNDRISNNLQFTNFMILGRCHFFSYPPETTSCYIHGFGTNEYNIPCISLFGLYCCNLCCCNLLQDDIDGCGNL